MRLDWSTAPEFGRSNAIKFSLQRLVDNFPSTKPLNVVEVGTSYRYDLFELGNAILAFVWFAAEVGAKVHVFDPLITAITSAQSILKLHGKPNTAYTRCRFHRESGYKVGEIIKDPIHFIYLDAFSGGVNHNICNEPNSDKNEWYQVVYNKAKHLFVKGSLILIDDTDPVTFEGKGATLVPFLIGEGKWERVKEFPERKGDCIQSMVFLEKVSGD